MPEAYKLELKPLANDGAVIKGDKYRFTVLTDRLIRMEYQEKGEFVDEATQLAVCREFPPVAFRILESDDSLEIITEWLHLYYDKKPFSPKGLTVTLKEGVNVFDSVWSYGDRPDTLGGTVRTLDGVDGAIPLGQGLVSYDGISVVDDSESSFLTRDGWVVAKNRKSSDLYFFGYGHDYLGCLRDFYRLSGHTPLLPRFTLGNWWSRYYRYTQEGYLALMKKFREKGIPLSVAVIDMDWHLTDIPKKYGSGWTGYTWNNQLFPDPKEFMKRLHEMGLKITLNVHPADGVRPHEEAYPAMAKELGVDAENEDRIAFDASDRKFMKAYFKYLHHPNEQRGVDFWWLDWQQGARGSKYGFDTLFLLNHLHFIDSGRNGKQPLTFSRYAGLGSHRYPVGFSGDSFSTWESLKFQPYFTATASNVGYSWWSHDIGGHQGGRRDDELAARWLQFGVFSPIMRLHSTANEFYGKEPWTYSMETEKVMTDFLRLRHRMIPYLHSMNWQTHLNSLPLMLPMYYRHDVREAYAVPNEYYFGTEMIACPVTSKTDSETRLAGVDCWLPEGSWFDLFTGRRYSGGDRVTLYRPIDSIPVLVKAGGIVPLAAADQPVDDNPRNIELHIYGGADGSFSLYEDRGGEPVITEIKYTFGKASFITLTQGRDEKGVIPAGRSYEIVLHGLPQPENVRFGEGLTGIFSAYDAEKNELRLRLDGGEGERMITLDYNGVPSFAGFDHAKEIYRILHRAQVEYSLKEKVYDLVCRESDKARLLGKLNYIEMPKSLSGAIIEQIITD